jgi:hypothetical protein
MHIEPWLRLFVTPAAIAPFVGTHSLVDILYRFMSFSELERMGWAAIVWLTVDAVFKIYRHKG